MKKVMFIECTWRGRIFYDDENQDDMMPFSSPPGAPSRSFLTP